MRRGAKIRIAEHIEIGWLEPDKVRAVCPNCRAAVSARQYLGIDYRPPEAAHRFVLQICPQCTARFVDNTHTMDYGSETLIEIGWHVYQVQLGAGVWPIAAPLTRVDKPAGARVLEIGGAYGFGLDFCRQARGWRGEGFDPSPLAAFGARELGLTLRQDYFTERHLAEGPWDVMIATEVIEHLEHPPEFFALMRRALAEDGVLVLTTPDAAWITPELSAGALMPLLSPGAHLVLQTKESLLHGLLAAGFGHVEVRREAMSLVAYASKAPLALREDAAEARAVYRRYLVERGAGAAPAGDLCFGFAGRGLFEAANDGDWAAAEAAWGALVPATLARFGLDLATLRALPMEAENASLAELARIMPLGLGMILFGRVMQLLGAGASRAAVLPVLRVAGAAIAALQNALAQRSLTDGLSASIGGMIENEILLCRAEEGEFGCVAALAELGDTVLGWRAFVALVNAGAYDAGRALRSTLLPALPEQTLPEALRRNALLSLANLALAPGGETRLALHCADALRALGAEADGIVLAAFTRLVNASRYEEALETAAAYDVDALARRAAAQTVGRDARLAQMVLDLAVGDPAEIPGRLAGLELPAGRRDILLLEAFIRLANASRFAEALRFAETYGIAALSRRVGGVTGGNAAIALAVVDLAAGDPAQVAGRFAGVEVEPARRDALVLGAFTGLVNTARYDAAEALAGAQACFAELESMAGPAAEDARMAALLLDLHRGRTEAAVRRIEGLAQGGVDAAVLGPLLVDGFVRLVNEQKFAAAARLAQGEAVARRLDDCPPELRQDALAALAILELQPGGNAARRVQRVEAAAQGGLEEARLQALAMVTFVTLVNAEEFDAARQLWPHVEPALIAVRPPYDDAACNGLFAAGMLFLQKKEELRRSANVLARLRVGLIQRAAFGAAPDALFWPALRGEVLALHALQRGTEAVALLQEFIGLYPGAPEDLRAQIEGIPA